MATALTTTLASACRAAKHRFTDNVFTRTPLLKRMWAKRWITSGGNQLEFPTRFTTGSTASTRNAYEEFTYAETDTVKTPALDWVYYQVTGKVPFEKKYMAYGENRVLELLAIELDRMEKELAQLLELHIFTGTSAEVKPYITGLPTICHASNTYAGINRATAGMEEWQGRTASQASLTHAELMAYIDTLTWNGKLPDRIITTKAIKTLMKIAWAASYQRYNQGPGKSSGVGISMLFTDFDFMGIPVEANDLCPAGEVHIWHDDAIKFAAPVGEDQFDIEHFTNESEYKGVKLRCAPMLQLCCTAPKLLYRITDVAACATS